MSLYKVASPEKRKITFMKTKNILKSKRLYGKIREIKLNRFECGKMEVKVGRKQDA